MPSFDDTKQEEQLQNIRAREEERLVQILSKKYALPYVADILPEPDALAEIKEDDARAGVIAPYAKKGTALSVAVFSPEAPETKAAIADLAHKGLSVSLSMASHTTLEKIWSRYKDISYAQKTASGLLDISGGALSDIAKTLSSPAAVDAALKETMSLKGAHLISKVFETILGGALALDASDIHMEPEEVSARIRYRLDGILHDVSRVDHPVFKLLISRVKLLSGLKLNVSGDTQDGRFSIKVGGLDIEIRTSVLPGPYGEAMVLRILNPKAINVKLEDLGLEPHLLEIILKQLEKPKGMILNTGPTGSGKTTSLYAFLKKIHSPEIKIITIEDPIEYHLAGITQTQVDQKTNYTFASGLRAALRQDPDVIMVGEIRDDETAKIAVNSALTGHLVLSTLHTNTAAGTIPRLTDLGVDTKTLATALNIMIAQRLVRKLCPTCKQSATPDEREQRIIGEVLTAIKAKRSDVALPAEPFMIWKPQGCAACGNTGYKGRVGVYEAIIMDKTIEELLGSYPSERQIKDAALHQGLFTMREDGVMKILQGMTSFDELARSVEVDEE